MNAPQFVTPRVPLTMADKEHSVVVSIPMYKSFDKKYPNASKNSNYRSYKDEKPKVF